MQRSWRRGTLAARKRKRENLPTNPRRVTVSSSTAPAPHARSSERIRTLLFRITRRRLLNGQARPRHFIRTSAPRGPRTLNSVSSAPPRRTRPAITILGKGESRRRRRDRAFFFAGGGTAMARVWALTAVPERGLELVALTTTRRVAPASPGRTR